MENQNLMLFISLAAPLCMMLFVFKGRARTLLMFLLSGIFMCLFAGEINGFIKITTDLSVRFLIVNVTPIVEEILKAIPIVCFAFLFKPDRQTLLESSVAVGVGFATLENICMFVGNTYSLSVGLVLARGFGAGIMHGVSTLAVGYSLVHVSNDRKLFFTGSVAALSAAIIYHSIFNILIQSKYPILGIVMPVLSFVPLRMVMQRKDKEAKEGME